MGSFSTTIVSDEVYMIEELKQAKKKNWEIYWEYTDTIKKHHEGRSYTVSKVVHEGA